MLPLEGLTVVALEQAVAAPYATRQLADLGARVVKVERAGAGDFARGYDETVHGQSSYFVWLNRGKESITLDIKDPADLDLLLRLLDTADVFVSNLAPGAVGRAGLGADVLRARNPRLITCTISGYGEGGPYQDKKAYDLLVQCEAGLLSVTGTPQEPAKAGISVADIAAGTFAFSGVLTALYERERTGLGTDVQVSMLEALGEWVAQPLAYAEGSGAPPPRSGARHASISPYGPYPVADGAQVFLGIQNDREWERFCTQVLGRPELADDPRFRTNPLRVANDRVLSAIVAEVVGDLAADDVLDRLEAAGIANARLRTMAELGEHPQLAARDRWRTVDSPGGTFRALLPPVTVPGREPRMGRVPAVGEHDEAVRAELGVGARA
ncbi:MAG TPA: CaiB/BaiF CoA-transferase family protein [Mycobacteriales bacterium]|jgi:crotonobetainyl-CoA:carnitine CoA-transferase CaiB-like acyl-CoA transferase|nr:CaiB/BaiF CoA-transferase family protein [Mycobacteriales bacterium]